MCVLYIGVEVDLNDVLDPHTVTGLLKLHFRELKVSLIPRGGPVTDIMNYIKNNDVRKANKICHGNK